MKKLNNESVLKVVNTIWAQLKGTTDANVICSWGIQNPRATQLLVPVDGKECWMAALVFDVNGFKYKGVVMVAYDDGWDYYRIFVLGENGKPQEVMSEVYFDEMGDKLDYIIEKGELSDVEYRKLIIREYLIQ